VQQIRDLSFEFLAGAGAPATAVAFRRDVWIGNPSRRGLELLVPP